MIGAVPAVDWLVKWIPCSKQTTNGDAVNWAFGGVWENPKTDTKNDRSSKRILAKFQGLNCVETAKLAMKY
ncbi:hypothetical protein D3C85_1482570 [compost metagenome]